MAAAVAAAYWPMRAMPDRRTLPDAVIGLRAEPVKLPDSRGPLQLVGAWELEARDPRFGGISALAIDNGRFLAVTDRGAALRFDLPSAAAPQVTIFDLREGPGPFTKQWARDGESLARDGRGRGWWVGFEQDHALWLYDNGFRQAVRSIELRRPDWRDNGGAEGLVNEGNDLLIAAENGRDVLRVGDAPPERRPLQSRASVADAALAPDGSAWLLLRSNGIRGIEQSIAPLQKTERGYRAGVGWPVPKNMFDNFEGMAIETQPGGSWRFWLISDDGHRIMARTLLVALDYRPLTNDKSPATGAGLSRGLSGEQP